MSKINGSEISITTVFGRFADRYGVSTSSKVALRHLWMVFLGIGFMFPTIIANAAGQIVWSIHLHRHNPFGPPFDFDYYGAQTYSSKSQAIAALRQLDPNGDFAGGESVLAETSISAMTPVAVSYQFAAPSVAVTVSPFRNFEFQLFSGLFATEQLAVDFFTFGPCKGSNITGDGASSSSVTPTSAWGPDPSQSQDFPPPNNYYEVRSYSWTRQSYDGNIPPHGGCDPPVTASLNMTANRSPSCPTGYIVFGGNTAANYSCLDEYTGDLTGQLLECPVNGSPSTSVGDPCDVLTGEFSQTESDYSGAGLSFLRYYHSATLESGHSLGVGWTHNYAAYLVLTGGVPTGLLRPDGHHDALITSTAGVYISLSGAAIHVQQSGTNWIATLKDGNSEVYNSNGQLIQLLTPGGLTTTLTYNSNSQLMSVSGPFGQALQFSYNSVNQLQQLIDPAGKIVTYGYDSNNNLTSVTYQDGTTRQYLYTNSTFPNNLTGIVDESSNQFLTVQYDPTTGAATSSQQAGGAEAVSITYSANGAVATDALGATHTYTFTNDPNYAPRVTALSVNTLTQSFAVPAGSTDPQRRITQSVDANGNITTYAYDANHLTSKTEASGTSVARTTSYQYLSTSSALPTLVTEPLRQISYQYYPGTNNVQYKTVTDTTVTPSVARTWTYTYDGFGRVLTAKGPRTDLNSTTTYAYYPCTTGSQCGQIQTITNAAGQITTFNTYNAYAQPLTITDPNGIVTTLTYDLRQRVSSRQVGTETTSYTYYPTGQLQTVTPPDGSSITNTYDAAHRLTDIADGLGNHTHYTLDAMGNRTAENTYDPSSTLKRVHTRVINSLNQLYQDINSADTSAVTTTLTYDNNGNVTGSAAPMARNTTTQYDPLNRVKQITDPNAGITKFSYDANDSLQTVIDPRNLTTSYTLNGFGEVTQLVSPDSGTSSSTYDSGGNLKTTTDARGALATYSYDALNRVSQLAYTDQTVNFSYDAGTNGVGRLTGASDANHALSWSYDSHGRVTGKGQTIGAVSKSVGYAYVNGDLTSLVTPSGQTVVYGYTNHRITSVTVNGTTILSGVTYDPFGPIAGWTWGNGTNTSRAFNQDGNLSQLQSAGETYSYSYDNASRITGIANTVKSNLSWTYGYDNLDRLLSANTSALSESWTYDANGNRLSQGGSYPVTLVVSPTSNQITSGSGAFGSGTATYDASGNTTQLQGNTATYNGAGRTALVHFNGATAQFVYNALGERIYKNASGSGVTLFMYDEGHHLIGEYGSSGSLIEETVWMDDTPVATLRPSGAGIAIYYVHTDHLNTPRKVSLPSSNALVWRADLDPFEVLPADNIAGDGVNQNPSGLGNFVYNLGYPGQYLDPETTIYQNMHRDYAASLGRYLESDPIGLRGGINTYGYIASNPIGSSDPLGLCAIKLRCGAVKIGFITVGWHCGVIAPNGVEYGLGGGDSSFNSSGTPHPYGGGLPEAARSDQVEYPVTCNCKSCGDVQNCIEAYHDWETPPGYLATGPNSNTYAHHMIGSCGCHAASTPSKATGYNFGFPYDLTSDNFPPSL